jgi:hypothetical protein
VKPGRRSSCVGCSYLKRIESSFQPTGTPQCRASSFVILWRWRIVLTQRLAPIGSGRNDHDIEPGKYWTRPTTKRATTPRRRSIAPPRFFEQAPRVSFSINMWCTSLGRYRLFLCRITGRAARGVQSVQQLYSHLVWHFQSTNPSECYAWLECMALRTTNTQCNVCGQWHFREITLHHLHQFRHPMNH